MNKSFLISEEERKRILNLHENSTKNQYLIISEATSHSKSVEPHKGTKEELDGNEEDTKSLPGFKPCLLQKARKGGWYVGFLGWDDSGGNQVGAPFYTPSKTSGPGMLQYFWDGNLYKQTGSTIEEIVFIRAFTCNERPFTAPAADESQLLQGKATLRFGDRGDMVKKLQEALVKEGLLPEDKVDSIFGNLTYKAVKEFQKNQGIKVDGVVGKDTWGKIMDSDKYETSKDNQATYDASMERMRKNLSNAEEDIFNLRGNRPNIFNQNKPLLNPLDPFRLRRNVGGDISQVDGGVGGGGATEEKEKTDYEKGISSKDMPEF